MPCEGIKNSESDSMKTLICKKCGSSFMWGGTRFKRDRCIECTSPRRVGRSTKRVTIGIMKHGWSKHGSRGMGFRDNPDEWVCQACGEDQIKELPGFNLPIDMAMRSFIKICSSCQSVVSRKDVNYRQLIKIVRRRSSL